MVDGGGESVGVAGGEEGGLDGGGEEGVEVPGDEGSGRCGNVSSLGNVEEDEEVG